MDLGRCFVTVRDGGSGQPGSKRHDRMPCPMFQSTCCNPALQLWSLVARPSSAVPEMLTGRRTPCDAHLPLHGFTGNDSSSARGSSSHCTPAHNSPPSGRNGWSVPTWSNISTSPRTMRTTGHEVQLAPLPRLPRLRLQKIHWGHPLKRSTKSGRAV